MCEVVESVRTVSDRPLVNLLLRLDEPARTGRRTLETRGNRKKFHLQVTEEILRDPRLDDSNCFKRTVYVRACVLDKLFIR